MKNREIADIFRQIGQILEVKGDNPFRIRAYERAAQNIESLTEDIATLLEKGRLKDIPGIGKDLEEKIQEIVSTGRLRQLDDLKKDVPQGILDMLGIPGIGPKTAKLLYERLNIQDIVMLERMAHAGKIRGLPGMGEKTEENILRGIELLKRGKGRMDIKTAKDVADIFVNHLKMLREVIKINPAGSLRRMKETVRDIDILISSRDPDKVMDRFTSLPEVKEILVKGSTKSSILTGDGVQVDMRVVEESSYGAALMYFTGSKDHNIKLRQMAIKKGLRLNEYGLFKKNKKIAGKSEEEIYKILGLHYIVPELREDRGEIEAALKGTLPHLIERQDIKGDLHTHSTWSDGGDLMEDMVLKARALGYEYIAITDHSQGLKIAGGLGRPELDTKRSQIEKLNKRFKDITVLFGAEVDIDSEGNLDYPDDILKEMDIVIAAVHIGFKQAKEKLTNRIIKACENRYVHIIAHPTGRLWGARDAYDIDLERICKICKDTGTFLEINSFPLRLDLNDINSKMAKEMGVRLCINTDAHLKEQLDMIEFGVSVGRRAWLERKDVVNTLPLARLRQLLKKGS